MLALILLGIVASAFAAPIVPVPPRGVAFVYNGKILLPFCLHNKWFEVNPLVFLYHLRLNHWVNVATRQPLKAIGGCSDVFRKYGALNSVSGGCDAAGKNQLRHYFHVITGYQESDAKVVCR